MIHKKQANTGALPDSHIENLIRQSFILNADMKNIKPSSLDITITDTVYEVPATFQVSPGRTVFEELVDLGFNKRKRSLSEPLEVGKLYVIKVAEKFDLPQSVYGYANPKSTSGRLDLHTRLLADHVSLYDSVTPKGFRGDLWLLVQPKSFPILLYPGISLNQVRLFYSDTRLGCDELEEIMQSVGLLYDPETKEKLSHKDMVVKDGIDSIVLTLDLGAHADGPVGYRARVKKKNSVIDYKEKYDGEDFFESLEHKKGKLYLEEQSFYILSALEAVAVPNFLACEMVPMHDRFGEFRSHYAGFIDPGWGWGSDGKSYGRPLTLEVRPFEKLLVHHRQPIASLRFERLAEIPQNAYDMIESNYKIQSRARLAKQFK